MRERRMIPRRAVESVRRLAGHQHPVNPPLRPQEAAAEDVGVILARRYVYAVEGIEKVTDGDTYWLHIDVGFRQSMLCNLRLFGYDCPERTRGTAFEKDEAIRARDLAYLFLTTALADGDPLWVRTEPDPDNFGRWLGEVWLDDVDGSPVSLGEYLRDASLASRWPTRWRDEFDPAVATRIDSWQVPPSGFHG